ncbi:dna-directed rna polymerase iii rpc9 [Cryptosporidium felis]|nr:dna-directed rna polymerase iii rpc9 [Cryptosporidium felis]
MKPKLASWIPLSSSEVYETIKNSENSELDGEFETPSLSFFRKSLMWYLEAFSSADSVPHEKILSFSETLHLKYGLSSQEIMQIVDLRPKKLVELHCIIPNCGKRLSEEDISDILSLIRNLFAKEK